MEIIGNLSINNKPGFVKKNCDGWTSIFCSIPTIPAEVLREIAKKSGVHIYCDSGDAIYACKNFVGIHTKEKGEKIIRFTEKKKIYDVFDKYNFLGFSDKINFYSDRFETKLFLIK